MSGMQIGESIVKKKMLVINNVMLLEERPGFEKEAVAEILQNDISQILAAVLLWLQSAREDETIAGNDQRLQLAETHLKTSIQ
jgi:hypothetical protein